MSDIIYNSTKPLEEFEVVKKHREPSGDLISRADAINVMCRHICGVDYCGCATDCKEIKGIMELPSAESEKTVYIPDTKAIPTARSCVDLAEKVTATFYDEEHEEWTQQTVTIADVLDSVCDEYTILPSAERTGHWIRTLADLEEGFVTCDKCGMQFDYYMLDQLGGEIENVYFTNYCPNCGARMKGEEE